MLGMMQIGRNEFCGWESGKSRSFDSAARFLRQTQSKDLLFHSFMLITLLSMKKMQVAYSN